MTTLPDEPPREVFRLSMLIYDSRYRSMTIQIVALIGALTLFGWLVSNTLQNLENLGKEIGFGFLGQVSGYDINQRLIDYSNQSSHLSAAIVGLLNTLLIAFMGVIAATIIGVIVGVLRLSNNWIVARLMTVYVEIFRNVPVLLWIVLANALLIETFPKPASFRGDDPEASLIIGETVAATAQGFFLPRPVPSDGAGWVLALLFIASLFVVRLIGIRANRIQQRTGDRPRVWPAKLAVLVVPVVVAYIGLTAVSSNNPQNFIIGSDVAVAELGEFAAPGDKVNYCHANGDAASLNGLRFLQDAGYVLRRKGYYSEASAENAFATTRCDILAVDVSETEAALARIAETAKSELVVSVVDGGFTEGRAVEVEIPELASFGIARFEGGVFMRTSFIALWLALSLYTAAFIAEIVRSGILAISTGQTEAAAALGLRPRRVMSLVVLPQALRVIIPPLISQFLNLTKNSSLAIAVGYMDITGTLAGVTLNQTGRELETVMLTMLIYLVISLAISGVMNIYNNSVKLKER